MSGTEIFTALAHQSEWNPLPPSSMTLGLVLLLAELTLVNMTGSGRQVDIAFPIVKIATIELDDRKCPVCLDEYAVPSTSLNPGSSEKPLRLPCGHIMGEKCLRNWCCTNYSCPVCRAPVTPRVPQVLLSLGNSPLAHEIIETFSYRARAYLGTNGDTTYAAFMAWALRGETQADEEARHLARHAIDRFTSLLVSSAP